METHLESLLNGLGLFWLRALIVLGLALLVALALRRSSAATLNTFWRGVFLALGLLPVLSWLPPLWQFPTPLTTPPLPTLSETPSAWVEVEKLPPLLVSPEPIEPPIPAFSWTPFFKTGLAIYLIGSFVILLRFFVGHRRLRQWLHTCEPVPNESSWSSDNRSESTQLGVKPVRLLHGPTIPMPLIYGHRHPSLLLPSPVLDAPASERRMILLHELAHVARRDAWFHGIRCLTSALHWPNPLYWIALRQFRLSEERAVDDLVVNNDNHAVAYAKLLSHFASSQGRSSFLPTPVHAMAQPSSVHTRIARVLDPTQSRRVPNGRKRSAIYGGLLGLFFLTGTLTADDPWHREAFTVDAETWATALQNHSTNNAETLLAKSGLPLPEGSAAVYNPNTSQVTVRAPKEMQTEIQGFFARTFPAQAVSDLAVELTCLMARYPSDSNAFIDLLDPPHIARDPWGEPVFGPLERKLGPAPVLLGVLTPEQSAAALQDIKRRPGVDLLAAPKLLVMNGQEGAVSISAPDPDESFYLSYLPVVGDAGLTIDHTIRFDPPSVLRRPSISLTMYHDHTAVFGKATASGNDITLVSSRIIKRADHRAPGDAKTSSRPPQSTISTIVLDPGHGGQDFGSRGVGGEEEAALVLDLARQVRRELEDHGYDVILTRQTDDHLTLASRIDLANKQLNAAFISLHYNASRHTETRGFETYYPAPRDGQAPRQASEALARSVQAALAQTIGDRTRNRGIRRANYRVLQDCRHPAIIVEGAFLSNPEDLALVKEPTFVNDLVEGIADGLVAFDGQTKATTP